MTNMNKSKTWKRAVSLVAAFAMVCTTMPENSTSVRAAQTVTKAAAETEATAVMAKFLGPVIGADGKVTFQYQGDGTEEAVQVKGSWGWDDSSKYVTLEKGADNLWTGTTTNLSLDSSYEYGFMVTKTGSTTANWANDPANPTADGSNCKINRNPQNNLDGSVTLYYYPKTEAIENGKVLYRVKGSSDAYKEAVLEKDKNYTSIYSANITGLEKGTYEYKYSINGKEEEELNAVAPEFTCVGEIPAEDPNVKSGVADGNKVKFAYYAPFAKEVVIAGSFNSWDSKNGTKAVYNEKTGYWEAEETLAPGIYEYKYIVDNTWLTDPCNSQTSATGNSQFVISGLTVDVAKVEKGKSVELPSTGIYYGTDGKEIKAEGITYTLDKEVAGVTLKDNTLAADASVEKGTVISLTATDNAGNKGTVTIDVVEKLYKYTIYYAMLEDGSWKDNSSLWIWQEGGSDGAAYPFASEFADEKNQITWLKADVELPYKELNIIARQGEWESQDATRTFTLPEGEENATLWIIDGQGLYTEQPADVKPAVPRYVVLEYNRPGKDFDGWNIYEWSSGYAMKDDEIKYPFAASGDDTSKATATVKIKSTISAFSFILRKSDKAAPWVEKDLGDRSIDTPLDQTVIKARMTEGSSNIEVLPYNKGYELLGKENKINFYYRNDELFLTNEQEKENVKVEIAYVPLNATTGASITCDMVYNKDTERFEYSYKNADRKLDEGTYYYRYIVSDSKDSSKTEIKTDVFNKNETVKFDESEYSYVTYRSYNAKVEPVVANTKFDYNTSVLMTVNVTGAAINANANQTADLDGMEIAECYADLTSLGGKKKTAIDPELMAISLSVTETTPLGQKNIPVTVVDQYGNEFTANAVVNVEERKAADKDFDWDESVIYFMVTDRFNDGNTANNDAYNAGDYDTKDPGKYHGGDFKGVTQKLDYLKDLGINTIWLTPIVENVTAGQSTTNKDVPATYGYHGYWASDFTSLNKHLGTPEEFQELVNEAHARGMKIMVDVVLNHAGYNTEELEQFNNMFRTEDKTVKDDYILSSDKSSGLPDFLTEEEAVRNKLIEWQTYWVKTFGIDYFRIDTVKHVESTTWNALKNKLTEINPAFKMIGEYYGAGYANSFGYLKSGSMDSLLDFDFNDNVRSFVTGNLESMERYFENRNAALDNTATMGSFLSSHDEDGIQYRLQDEDKLTKEEAYNETMVAAALQMTAKGQPVIYYGEEIGLTGADDYPLQTNRYDMKFDSLSDSETKMLNHYKKLLSIRNANTKIFAKGSRTKIAGSDADKYMVFERSYGEQSLYVGVNTDKADKQVTLTYNNVDNGVVTDLYSGKTYPVAGGKATITIPSAAQGGTVVLQLNKDNEGNTSVPTGPATNTPVPPATDDAVKAKVVGEMVYDEAGNAVAKNILVQPQEAELSIINGVITAKVQLPENYINQTIDGMTATAKTNLKVSLGTDLIEKVIAKEGTNGIKFEVVTPDSTRQKVDDITVTVEQPVVAIAKKLAKKLTVIYKNAENKSITWTFTINDLKISKVTSPSALNCDIVVTPATASSIATKVLKKDKNNSKGLIVDVKNTAKLPADAKIKVYVGTAQGVTAGKTAYIYYLNEKTSKLEELAVSSAKVSSSGYISFCIRKGGKYVVLGKKASSTVTKTVKSCIKTTIPKAVKKGKKVKAKVTLSGCLIKVSSLSSASLKKLQSGTLGAKISYTSSKKKIASVNASGVIKGKKKGKTVIKVTVKLSNGKKYSYSQKVTVK